MRKDYREIVKDGEVSDDEKKIIKENRGVVRENHQERRELKQENTGQRRELKRDNRSDRREIRRENRKPASHGQGE